MNLFVFPQWNPETPYFIQRGGKILICAGHYRDRGQAIYDAARLNVIRGLEAKVTSLALFAPQRPLVSHPKL